MSNTVRTAAQDIQGILLREGTWVSGNEVETVRDIASFTVTAPSGQRFTVAISPAAS